MSCTDCVSNETKRTGDGSTTLFTFDFTYINRDDVYVELFNYTTRRWVATTDWTFSNAATIQFNTAPDAPADTDIEAQNIRIARCTDIDSLFATFASGSAIRAQDLNFNFEQLQLAVQEGRCNVPDWLYDRLENEYWNKYEDTTYSDDTWADEADDDHVPTTEAVEQELSQRWDKRDETTYTTDTWVDDNDDVHVPTTGAVQQELVQRWDKRTETTYIADDWDDESDDDHVPTTGAVDRRIDSQIQDNYDNRKVTRPEQTTDGGSGKIDDVHYFTTAASAARHDAYVQDNTPATVTYEQNGKIWNDTDDAVDYFWDADDEAWVTFTKSGPQGPKGDQGVQGPQGDKGDPVVIVSDTAPSNPSEGDIWFNGSNAEAFFYYCDRDSCQWVSMVKPGLAATVEVGSTTTGNPGTDALVTNSGSESAAVFNFTIPRGEDGTDGNNATVDVGSTTTGQPGTNASVTNSGTTQDAIFNFTIPRGDQGETGPTATVDVGSTTTGLPGTDADVTNSGTPEAAVFNFTIPRGDKGEPGKDFQVHVSDTAPINPETGDFWFDSSKGESFIYYDDGDSQQWVALSKPGPPGADGADGNLIANTGDTAPINPVNGQTWFNTDVGRMFVYYTDGISSQWVQS